MPREEIYTDRSYQLQQEPYNADVFRTFVQILLRLFYDSPIIIVGDCLIREQKAYSDKDLAEKLSLSDRQVREALKILEDDFIILKEQKPTEHLNSKSEGDSLNSGSSSLTFLNSTSNISNSSYGNIGFNRMSPIYYRINPHLPTVVEWQYNTIIHNVEEAIKEAASLDELVCKICNVKYTSLDALGLELSQDDGFFLCRYCNEKLQSGDSASFRQATRDKAERTRSQLQVLYNSLERVKNMYIPIFPLYQGKNEKLKQSRPIRQITDISKESNSTVASNNVVNSSNSMNSNSLRNPGNYLDLSESNTTLSFDSGTGKSFISSSVPKVKFGIKLSSNNISEDNRNKDNIGFSGFSKKVFNLSKTQELSNNRVNTNIGINKTALNKPEDSLDNNTSYIEKSQNSRNIEEPTLSISAINGKIFKISEITDDIINVMTDSEFLKYDELLQNYQTVGLLNS
ncbi:uncharacterized protein CMU_018870 [Cryptosporidium muris RN66]|uniref:HTH TFE/IIEalpha-type domain-containing protein n=1 Tax=Cryptosporidium muris (strain RN66) TaxID=441375 RepID=B6AC74_CRYMR|nr:uncharacterized protein CMU_018870 [Cryptosporidium muris RN66]EEA06130.1 hypothetical protein, conserved [Cryptosporidium muris RN66]|eukprot:XP_002140479.1 hypothetical protein [Cryptosporidium muris RN66]